MNKLVPCNRDNGSRVANAAGSDLRRCDEGDALSSARSSEHRDEPAPAQPCYRYLCYRALVSLSAILFAAIFAVTAQAQTGNDRVQVTWSDPSRPGLVTVSLLSGSISVKTHGGPDVTVQGSSVGRRGRNPDRTPDGLTRIDTNGGLIINEANNVLTISSPSFMEGANIEIEVPVKTNLKLNTINGNTIVVDGVDGQIEVTNTNGNVRLVDVSGSVVAHAMNGNLFATVKEVAPDKTMSFSSFNSNVDVTLPPATKGNLKLRSDNGAVYSDFDIKLNPNAPPVTENTRDGRGNGRLRIEMDRTTSGTINGGGPDIEIRTFNGNIYLRKAK